MKSHLYLKMLRHLRESQEIILFGNLLEISEEEINQTASFLRNEYEKESIEFPGNIPKFIPEAALWGARTIYIAAQLVLYREKKASDFNNLLPDFGIPLTPGAFLSADLTLRFLPSLINYLTILDPDVPLISVLEKHLTQWHYSGINYPLDRDKLDFTIVLQDQCLKQLYVNRVTFHKKTALAHHPFLQELIQASLGIFGNVYWPEFKYTPIA